MKPHRLLVIPILIALLAGTAVAEEKDSPVERYKQAHAGKRAAERFLNAKDALDQSPDASTLNEAAAGGKGKAFLLPLRLKCVYKSKAMG